MSQCRDDYAPPTRNLADDAYPADSEPADPTVPDHPARRGLPLAPESVKPSRLPEPFRSDKGRAVTVAEAGEIYLKVQRANWNDDSLTSKHERHKNQLYPRLLEADRQFRADYDELTTAMLTRRLSPLDDSGSWLTPWECNEMLHGGSVHRSVRQAINYQLDGFEYEWVAVTAPTESAGTPHEHIYFWIDDPDNEIRTDHLATGLEKHLKYCANAYEKHHQYRTDGTGGALTVQSDPGLIESIPAEFFTIEENSPTVQDTGTVLENTAGAQYLASQLAHLPLADFYDETQPDPSPALFEGAALAWASPRDWFRASRGVPELTEAR
jgi:hypothetical protein